MSGRGRGGRGGSRGGFGARKIAPQGMPGADDPGLQFNEKPQETYPKSYKPPTAPPLSDTEARTIASFVAFRKAFHATPYYTHRHLTSGATPGVVENVPAPDPSKNSTNTTTTTTTARPPDPRRRTYGQAQVNARFGIKNRATIDPFLAVPLYSHKFVDANRMLPDLRSRPTGYVSEFFPEELWATLEGRDGGGLRGGFLSEARGTKRGVKRKAAAVVVDGESLGSDDDTDGWRRRRKDETEEQRKARIEAAIKEGENEDAENKEDIDIDEEEEGMSQEDDDYDDEDEGGDYDAEAYFDAGDNDDYGDEEGVGESAMDF
ncbi:DNA-directed RNA polymerase III, subunit Rpc31 [Hypoxylon trugodes]|uniref:DNA-directed RNA polymerase III, subunit Rpc31 n=1 Tax=Hypoxylon trugodes TaxID=326681 RepID=UPI00219C1F55|nr:DNA-directed RNA polymerase III, subunit Rpc31 [Hypoxylon trugodes]KAI1383761.1 DNA-directed RNA polymerase III, subunit Rpc31 [Hypoxylon trugodes]